MRFTLVLAIAMLIPAALTARPTGGLHTADVASDVSAAKKKKPAKKQKKPKEEYLKAAPGTGPSGPKK